MIAFNNAGPHLARVVWVLSTSWWGGGGGGGNKGGGGTSCVESVVLRRVVGLIS